jgi:hypothetical protein
MAKKSSKKTTKKSTKKAVDFEPNRMSLAVAATAVTSLVLLAVLTSS